MSILFVIPYHHLDSVLWLRYTVSQELKYGDVVIVTDENAPRVAILPPKVKQLWINGFGVGKARDFGIKYALQQGYDCVIFSDSHMIVGDDVVELCKYKVAQPAVVPVDVKHGGLVEAPPVYGDFLDEYTWRWWYIMSTTKKKSIMSTQPMVAFNRDVLEALVSANNGWFTQCWYWGKELFDPSLSATRLGFDVDLVTHVKVGHVYKEGSPKGWRKRFSMRRIDQHEPWYPYVVTSSPYLFGIKYADCVYAMKHYSPEEWKALPLDPVACEVAMKNEVLMNSIAEFNKNAVRTRREAYELLRSYLDGAVYVPV